MFSFHFWFWKRFLPCYAHSVVSCIICPIGRLCDIHVVRNQKNFKAILHQAEYKRNVAAASLFFCSCTCVKVLFTNTFLKCRFPREVEIISIFPLRTNVAFFLNRLFLCIHVNKGFIIIWHIIWLIIWYSQFTMKLKSKMAACFNLENSEISRGLSVLTRFARYWITKSITSPLNSIT